LRSSTGAVGEGCGGITTSAAWALAVESATADAKTAIHLSIIASSSYEIVSYQIAVVGCCGNNGMIHDFVLLNGHLDRSEPPAAICRIGRDQGTIGTLI
jgi:hypothetical protein